MRHRALLIGLIGLLLAADAAKDEASKKDLEQLQGTWLLVSAERDGKKASEEEVKKVKLVVTGNKFRFLSGAEVGTSAEGTFTIDATKKPKATDSTANSGDDKGKTFLGIYDIEGDTHKVCFAPPGKDRPKEFATKAGSGHIFQVWKREKK
jgi:uncharacterized protein (TIGR03067 family)